MFSFENKCRKKAGGLSTGGWAGGAAVGREDGGADGRLGRQAVGQTGGQTDGHTGGALGESTLSCDPNARPTGRWAGSVKI